LPHLSAGSWINHNFAIWVGDEEDNTGWDALHKAREHLRGRAQQPHIPPDKIRQAWEEFYIAEGSDWFWWYGPEHSSAQDLLFDYLFRKHLQNVYLLLGDSPPPELNRPISKKGQRPAYSQPRSFLDVKIDGRETFFEWLSAGRYICQTERGTIAQVTSGPIKDVYFGFTLNELLVRVDFDRPAKQALADFDDLHIVFVEPKDYALKIEQPGRPNQRVAWAGPNANVASAAKIQAGLDKIVEASIPFALLGVTPGQAVQFHVELMEAGQSRDRAPREGTIVVTCPSADFEQIMWDV